MKGSVCLTLCDPMDCSLPSSSIHGILQTRILVWVAISFSIYFLYLVNFLFMSFLLLLHFGKISYVFYFYYFSFVLSFEMTFISKVKYMLHYFNLIKHIINLCLRKYFECLINFAFAAHTDRME